MAMSLSDTVSNGDYVNAYIYTDTVGYSDTYCYFDLHNYTAEENESVTLTLMSIGFDDQYNPVSYPVSGASVVIDGAKTNYVTDDDGSVSIICDKAGSFVISAVSDGQTLVPPVSILTVNAVTTAISSDLSLIHIFYCSGGCAANAYHATGSVSGIYKYGCELFRKRMECAIMLEAAKAEEEE